MTNARCLSHAVPACLPSRITVPRVFLGSLGGGGLGQEARIGARETLSSVRAFFFVTASAATASFFRFPIRFFQRRPLCCVSPKFAGFFVFWSTQQHAHTYYADSASLIMQGGTEDTDVPQPPLANARHCRGEKTEGTGTDSERGKHCTESTVRAPLSPTYGSAPQPHRGQSHAHRSLCWWWWWWEVW
jgi:hypothetical protein